MKLVARTPTRVDLAGGTLDIYPLYVFEGGGVTVNAAISLESTVWVESRDDGSFYIRSLDLELTYRAPSFETLDAEAAGPLGLVVRAIQHYEPPCGLSVTTRNTTPAGSGLGSSSSLLIALSGALNRFRGNPLTKEQIIDFAANIEAQAIQVPTGKQDYYAAMYGGVQAIHFGMLENTSEVLLPEEEGLRELERRLILSYTGESRFSGANNWAMMKRYIDQEGDTVERLRAIKRTAEAMRECLLEADFDRFAELLREEWENRKGLAEGVSTPRIERIMAAASSAGALASKICGAGGGGAMITYAPPEKRAPVEQALREAGAEILAFRIARQGLVVEERS
jgi:D-glycero-alpha-D-manno-heptose-7-phosphate kinase